MNANPPPTASRFPRPERLLPFACIASAGVLFASEFMTTFQLTGGELGSGNALCDLQAAERHHFALGLLAIFAVLAVIIAVFSASKPAAVAVAIAGIGALLLFLIIDLPKANNVGSISSACDLAGQGFDAKAVPQAGFWLEMVGALGLALSGAALATLSRDQLATLLIRRRRPRIRNRPAGTEPVAGGEPAPAEANPEPQAERPARTRQRN